MNKLKELLNNQFIQRYGFLLILLVLMGAAIGTSTITYSKYETNTKIDLKPTVAFFIVDVQSETKTVKLESMIPSDDAYLYRFDISNFNDKKRANVDLKYSIEIITTTNMPLEFKVYKDPDLSNNMITREEFTTNDDGVYYKHLLMNNISPMYYRNRTTDIYYLWVKFPIRYKDYPEYYSGIIDLVDIKVNAEQVV